MKKMKRNSNLRKLLLPTLVLIPILVSVDSVVSNAENPELFKVVFLVS
jgi:hypothetical protein